MAMYPYEVASKLPLSIANILGMATDAVLPMLGGKFFLSIVIALFFAPGGAATEVADLTSSCFSCSARRWRASMSAFFFCSFPFTAPLCLQPYLHDGSRDTIA